MDDNFAIHYVWLIPLLPLVGAVISGLFGAKFLRGKSHWPIWLTVGASAVLSFMVLTAVYEASHSQPGPVSITKNIFTWIAAGNPASVAAAGQPSDFFHVNAGYFIDPLTAVMLCVVCGVGFLITVFSAGYMKGEEGYWRFFAYLGLFIFMMTNLVMGENLLMLYLGWEGVGLCSYLLIGYYYNRPSARDAAVKAFIVNRVGDLGFALGIMLCFAAFGTVSYFGDGFHSNTGLIELFLTPTADLSSAQQLAVHWVPFLLMLGAFGKSAQFPLYVWLPDAMEGPTPVSALIHAATMVTAGVYMISRCATLFFGPGFMSPMTTIAIVGAFTAFFAATIAMRQFDLKKVFAYSTVSQLGYMFVGVAVLAPVAGVFHLVTHAFFKALLFLSCGVVMHAMNGEIDMRKISGLKRILPKTRWLMLAGCASLAGFPLITSGFYSKDDIIGAAWADHKILAGSLMLTAFITAYYTFRLYFRVFHGPTVIPGSHSEHDTADAHHNGHHNHEPFVMIAPLVILAIGAIFIGPWLFQTKSLEHFLGKSPSFYLAFQKAQASGIEVDNAAFGVQTMLNGSDILVDKAVVEAQHQTHLYLMIVSGALALLGIGIAYLLHKKDRKQAEELAAKFSGIATVLDHKYWIDDLYDAAIVRPLWRLGQIYDAMDRWVIDGAVWFASFVPQVMGFSLKISLQRGSLQGYAASMLFGLVIIVIAFFVL